MAAGWERRSTRVFVDASGWLAAMNRRDQHHGIAQALVGEFLRGGIEMVTTNWTAYEALSILKSRTTPDLVTELWELLLDADAVAFTYVTPEIERRALDLFFGYRDKAWGVVDCASLIVMEELGCRRAVAFDRHFVEASRQRGFEVLG